MSRKKPTPFTAQEIVSHAERAALYGDDEYATLRGEDYRRFIASAQVLDELLEAAATARDLRASLQHQQQYGTQEERDQDWNRRAGDTFRAEERFQALLRKVRGEAP